MEKWGVGGVFFTVTQQNTGGEKTLVDFRISKLKVGFLPPSAFVVLLCIVCRFKLSLYCSRTK